MLALLDAGIEIVDLEDNDGEVLIIAESTDDAKVKDVVESIIPGVEYDVNEIGWYPKEKVKLEGEDLELFNRCLNFLENVDDVTNVYHNVDLGE